MKFEIYKTNIGLYLRNPWGASYNGYTGTPYISKYKINGQVFPDVVRGGCIFLEGLTSIDAVQKLVAPSRRHNGYELKPDTPEALKGSLKPFYTVEEVGAKYNSSKEEYDYENVEFAAVCGLYTFSYEGVPEYWADEPFEVVILGEYTVSNWQEPEKMEVRLYQKDMWHTEDKSANLADIVNYSMLEKALTPEFILHARPCFLTSEQVYKIVRAHIKDNIKASSAEITSDYDFCFTVKRKLHKKPISIRREITKRNGRSFATPKFKYLESTFDLVEIFEMTDNKHRYSKYTVIEGWEADNLEAMHAQVKFYLDALMEEINKEVSKCPSCDGTGHVWKKIDIKDRSL